MEPKGNVAIIIRLCFLNDICSLYPNEHSIFRVRINLFSTACLVDCMGLKNHLESEPCQWKIVLYCTELYLIVLNGTELYWIVLNCTELYWIVLNGTELYWIVLNCTELYLMVLNCTELYWIVLNCTQLYSIVLNCTELYWIILNVLNLLPLFYSYVIFYIFLSPSISERDISTSAYRSICFIVMLNLNCWIMRLKIVVEGERMFCFKLFSLFWLQKQTSKTQCLWTLEH